MLFGAYDSKKFPGHQRFFKEKCIHQIVLYWQSVAEVWFLLIVLENINNSLYNTLTNHCLEGVYLKRFMTQIEIHFFTFCLPTAVLVTGFVFHLLTRWRGEQSVPYMIQSVAPSSW